MVCLIDKVIYLRLDARKLIFLITCTGHIPKDDIDARDNKVDTKAVSIRDH